MHIVASIHFENINLNKHYTSATTITFHTTTTALTVPFHTPLQYSQTLFCCHNLSAHNPTTFAPNGAQQSYSDYSDTRVDQQQTQNVIHYFSAPSA
jgi:hypothetical protein